MAQVFRVLGILALVIPLSSAKASGGATVPWTTYEAEDMVTTGTILGPQYAPNLVASESSGRKCVQLDAVSDYVQFTALAGANAVVVRYSVPDTADGAGTNYTLSLYTNGVFASKLDMTSKYSWLYGSYPFVNSPVAGSPRNFYDEVRAAGLGIKAGDLVRLQKDSTDAASNYVLDLVELESVAAPLTPPVNSLSIVSYGAVGDGITDCTAALQNCINAAQGQKTVWMPAGTYVISGNINLPSNTTVQGAGMWFTKLIGQVALYNTTPSRRINFNGNGSNIHLADFAITGFLNYRNDGEGNDGLGGSYGAGSTIARIWIEHTKAAAWILNSSGLVVEDCRFRNTLADGINLNRGMRNTTVTNCTARGTGDDCFAIWPSSGTQSYPPELNVITHCTAQMPFLANGGAIYGGNSNRIENCLFRDIPYGCGILISTTFPVGGNAFSGTTVAQASELDRCGGYDPGWGWRAALQLCLDHKSLSGVRLNNLNITDSISDGLSIIAPGSSLATGVGTLSNTTMANVSIPNCGIGAPGSHGVWIRNDAIGSMTVSNSTVVDYRNDSTHFTFDYLIGVTDALVTVTVQPSVLGRSFTVDGTAYTTTQDFNWIPGSSHALGASSPQSGGAGIVYVWSSWSDGGAISHSITPSSNTTYTANFITRYLLTMSASAGGSVSPVTDWFNEGTTLNLSAAPSNGYGFSGWTGSGIGSYSGSSNPASITMNGPIAETASFVAVTSVISLAGDLAFGDVTAGSSSNRTLLISNAGNLPLTIGSISYPNGFSGDSSGTIPAGGSTNVVVRFSPSVAGSYTGSLTVNSDATSGVNTRSVSGVGVVSPDPPPRQRIIEVILNANASVTLTYATTPGYSYRLETATNLSPAIWATVVGSLTNATDGAVTFTDPNPLAGDQRYYRTASP
jgi:hypothetical protein